MFILRVFGALFSSMGWRAWGEFFLRCFTLGVQGQNAQSVAYQREELGRDIYVLFQRDTGGLFPKIQKRNLHKISSRAMRIAVDILSGGVFSQINPDGGDAGRGSALTADFLQITSVYFAHATEYSKLMESATEGEEKAIAPAAKRNLENAVKQIRINIESLIAGTDGSGTLDTVVSVSGNVVTVNNPNQFQQGQVIQWFNGLGTPSLGASQVLSPDANAKTITLYNAPPNGVANGTLAVIAGAPGTAASSLFGVETFQVDSNVGTYLQLSRAAYPGMLKTPHVSMNGQAITPQAVRTGEVLLKRAIGIEAAEGEMEGAIAQLPPDQVLAWENTGLVVSSVIQNQLGGNRSENMLKAKPPKQIGPWDIMESIHAKPGRIDVMCLKNWGRGETQAMGDLDFGGQTFFPIYGGSGGLSMATINYIWCGFQVFNANPRAGVFWDNCAIPASL